MHLRESARHRRITRILEDRFELWGYAPVETPLVDYVEVYRELLPEPRLRDTYRVVDRQGEVLAVRSDTTLFLAKQLGLHLTTEELPVRVWYNDQIVRAEEEDEIAANEYQQAGLELVGSNGIESDMEVLVILQDTLQALDLGDAAIHLGSHRIIEEAARTSSGGTSAGGNTDSADAEQLRSVVSRRRPIPEEFGVPRDVEELLRFIGSPEAFRKLLSGLTLPGPVRHAGEALLERALPLDHTPAIRIDTSELGAHDYYTGIAFGVYHPGSTAAIARGGRYDELLGHFGFDAPSVGFSMFTRKFPCATQEHPHESLPAAPGKTFTERLARARESHNRGERMHL